MVDVLNKYKGVILFVLVTIVMFNMYTERIQELNSIEQNVAYYENK